MTTLEATQTAQSTRPTHVFRAAERLVWIYFSMFLAFFIPVLALMAHVPVRPISFLPSVFALIWAVWVSNGVPIRLYEDRIEMQSAPTAPRFSIPFEEIEALDETKKKRVLLRAYGDAPGVGLRIPLHLLTKRNRTRLLNKLSMRI